jgi:hypothetical protein
VIALETAHEIAREWLDAWNQHDLEAIMAHYADDIQFWSPLIVQRLGLASGKIESKAQLRSYFAQGLESNPNLHFTLLQVLTGVDSLTIYYRRDNGLESAEMMVLDEHHKVIMARVHYNGPL